jgi:hypothetical protein
MLSGARRHASDASTAAAALGGGLQNGNGHAAAGSMARGELLATSLEQPEAPPPGQALHMLSFWAKLDSSWVKPRRAPSPVLWGVDRCMHTSCFLP